jgi:hypothetical protein
MAESSDWEAIKRKYHYRCVICRQPEKVAGMLVQVQVENAVIPPQVFPLCPEHNLKYSQGYFTNIELKKIGISREQYLANVSDAGEKIEPDSPPSTTEKAILAQQDAIKMVQKSQKKRFQQTQSDFRKDI